MLPQTFEIKADNLELELTKENIDEYKIKASDYLPEGTYAYIAGDTFFLTYITTPASRLGSVPLPYKKRVVDSAELLPSLSALDPLLEISTMVLSFTVSKAEFDKVMSGAEITVQKDHLFTEFPELGHTKALANYLKMEVFREEMFTLSSNETLLSQPICQFATSKPDLAVWHKEKYVFQERLLGGVLVDGRAQELGGVQVDGRAQEQEENLHILTGAVAEDKPLQQMAVNQVVAAMLLLATALGSEAVREEKYFKKALIFGELRNLATDNARVYKLELDFERGVSRVYMGKQEVPTAKFIQGVKLLLEDPQIFL